MPGDAQSIQLKRPHKNTHELTRGRSPLGLRNLSEVPAWLEKDAAGSVRPEGVFLPTARLSADHFGTRVDTRRNVRLGFGAVQKGSARSLRSRFTPSQGKTRFCSLHPLAETRDQPCLRSH